MLFDQFKELFESSYQKNLRICKLKQEIKKKDANINTAKAAIQKLTSNTLSYPIIVGNGLSRASIVDIGTFPPHHYSQNFIFPKGYKVKKRYKPHLRYKKSMGNKVLYLCSIGHDGVTITADDGYEWKGNDLWSTFKQDTGIQSEFNSLEDFMVLNNPTVAKMIEELGDISSLSGYVPYLKRHPTE